MDRHERVDCRWSAEGLTGPIERLGDRAQRIEHKRGREIRFAIIRAVAPTTAVDIVGRTQADPFLRLVLSLLVAEIPLVTQLVGVLNLIIAVVFVDLIEVAMAVV